MEIGGLSEELLRGYQQNLTVWEERLQQFKNDPENTPPDFVVAYLRTKAVVEKKKTEFSDAEELELLAKLEHWYTDKEITFPNKEWLEEQRRVHSV